MEALKQTYAQWGWLVILVKGLTPIPYKLVTIVSGLLGYNFPLFVALSVVTRGARFFMVAGALHWFGEPLRAAMERNFAAVPADSGAGRRRLRDCDQGLLNDARRDRPAALASGEGAHDRRGGARHPRRGLDLSGARLSALRALSHPALRLLSAAPLAFVTAAASRSAHGLARAGFALLAAAFVASAALAAYHAGVEYHWWAGPTACTGALTGSLDVNDLVKSLDWSRSCAATRSSCGLPDCRWPAGTSWPALRSRSTRRLRRGFRAKASKFDARRREREEGRILSLLARKKLPARAKKSPCSRNKARCSGRRLERNLIILYRPDNRRI